MVRGLTSLHRRLWPLLNAAEVVRCTRYAAASMRLHMKVPRTKGAAAGSRRGVGREVGGSRSPRPHVASRRKVVKAAPPSTRFSAFTLPPWASTRPRQIARPSPTPAVPARRLRPVEPVEDERQVDRVDAGAVVGHRAGGPSAPVALRRQRAGGRAGPGAVRPGAASTATRDVPPGRRELERVVEQVADHLQQAVAVAQHDDRASSAVSSTPLAAERGLGAGPTAPRGDLGEVDRLVLDGSGPRSRAR